MRKIPLIGYDFEVDEIIYCGKYCSGRPPFKFLYSPIYAKVINITHVADHYIMYTFHIMSLDGLIMDDWWDANYMIEHVEEKFEIFRLELNEKEKAKLLLMGL